MALPHGKEVTMTHRNLHSNCTTNSAIRKTPLNSGETFWLWIQEKLGKGGWGLRICPPPREIQSSSIQGPKSEVKTQFSTHCNSSRLKRPQSTLLRVEGKSRKENYQILGELGQPREFWMKGVNQGIPNPMAGPPDERPCSSQLG